jgi:hypothetical protein
VDRAKNLTLLSSGVIFMRHRIRIFFLAFATLWFLALLILWFATFHYDTVFWLPAKTHNTNYGFCCFRGELQLMMWENAPRSHGWVFRPTPIGIPGEDEWYANLPQSWDDNLRRIHARFGFGHDELRVSDPGVSPVTWQTESRLYIPLYALILPWSLPILFPALISLKRRQRAKKGLCLHCGYDIRATTTGETKLDRCPECGTQTQLV